MKEPHTKTDGVNAPPPSAFPGWAPFLYWVCRIACQLRPRFNRAWPPLPADVLPTLPMNAGTSTLVTCASARSRSAPACRLAKILGVGPDGANYSNGNVV